MPVSSWQTHPGSLSTCNKQRGRERIGSSGHQAEHVRVQQADELSRGCCHSKKQTPRAPGIRGGSINTWMQRILPGGKRMYGGSKSLIGTPRQTHPRWISFYPHRLETVRKSRRPQPRQTKGCVIACSKTSCLQCPFLSALVDVDLSSTFLLGFHSWTCPGYLEFKNTLLGIILLC